MSKLVMPTSPLVTRLIKYELDINIFILKTDYFHCGFSAKRTAFNLKKRPYLPYNGSDKGFE